jgi:ribonuclease BN (tRNA processing enzyme)
MDGPGWDLVVVGCGDAFGSGGRLQASFHLGTPNGCALIDCGATSLIGMQRLGLDPNEVRAILVSHLHGDHFGGLIWWLMHAHYVSNRTAPLTVIGPPGLRDRLSVASEALFPSSTKVDFRFPLEYREFTNGRMLDVEGLGITPFEVRHPSGAPAFALRLESRGRCLSYSGDTEWSDSLIACARGADLFIVDCFGYDIDVGFHMSWKTLSSRLGRVDAQRIMLTHMGPDMLARVGEIKDPRIVAAEDGLVLRLGEVKR